MSNEVTKVEGRREPAPLDKTNGKSDETPIKLAYIRFHETVSARREGGGGGDQIYGDFHFSLAKREGASMGDRGEWDILAYMKGGYVTIHHPRRPDVLPVIVPMANVVYMVPYNTKS